MVLMVSAVELPAALQLGAAESAHHNRQKLTVTLTIDFSHCAVDELSAALQLGPAEWVERYRFPKPGAGSPVVLQCRTQRRSSWAAQLAADAGLHNVLVYKQVRHICQKCVPLAQMRSGVRRRLALWVLRLLLV